jgi:hypothetical protein
VCAGGAGQRRDRNPSLIGRGGCEPSACGHMPTTAPGRRDFGQPAGISAGDAARRVNGEGRILVDGVMQRGLSRARFGPMHRPIFERSTIRAANERVLLDLIWQQFGNNIGHVSPTCHRCHDESRYDANPVCISGLSVTPTCRLCHVRGTPRGHKILWAGTPVWVRFPPPVLKLRRGRAVD